MTTINIAANTSYSFNGNSTLLIVGDGATVTIQGSGNTVQAGNNVIILDSGVGESIVAGTGSSVSIANSSGASVGAGSSVTVTGVQNGVNASNGTVTLRNGATTQLNGSGDHISGGYNTYINLFCSDDALSALDNAAFDVHGDRDSLAVGASGSGTVVGTNDRLTAGANLSTNVQNTGGGTFTVMTSNASGYIGLLGGGGYEVDASNATIATWSNTQFRVVGSGDTVNLVSGDLANVSGGGNTINTGANTQIGLGGTNGVFDTVNATGDGAGGAAMNGAATGIYLADDAQANLFGSGNKVGVGTRSALGAYGGSNVIDAGAASLVVLGSTGDHADWVYGSGIYAGGTTDNGQLGTGIYLLDGAQCNVTGDNDGISAGNNTVLGVFGTGDTVGVASAASVNVQNTGSGTDTVVLNGSSDYVGLLGGSGYEVDGSHATIATWSNTQFRVVGSGDTVNVASGDLANVGGGGNTINTGANTQIGFGGTNGVFDTVNASGDGVGGAAMNGATTGIYLADDAQANLFGSGNKIGVGIRSALGAYGGSNVIDAGAASLVVLGSTGDHADWVYGSGIYSGGTTDNGQLGTGIYLNDGAQSNITGDNDGISADNNTVVGVFGTGDTVGLASAASVNIQNTGSGTDTVVLNGSSDNVSLLGGSSYEVNGSHATINRWSNTQFRVAGSGNTVNVATGDLANVGGGGNIIITGANTQVGLGGTNGVFDTVYASGDASGGADMNGSPTGIYLADNAQANLFGGGNTIGLGAGDSFGAYGGANVIDAVASDLVVLGQTSGLFDTVYGSNVTAGGTSDSGQLPTGLYVADGAQANVVGSGNTISVGQSGILGAYGNGNQIAAQAYAGVVVSGNNNSVSTTSAGLATFSGIGNSAAVNGTVVTLLDGNAVAISGTPANAAAVQAALANSPQTANDIDEVYLEVLGRGVDATGLSGAQFLLAGGGSLAGLRAGLAGSLELSADMGATYAAIGTSPPTQAELDGFRALFSAGYDAPLTLIGSGGVLANTSPTNLLAELPVLQTLDNGRTLSLGLPDGSNLQFASTARLADFLYAAAVQKSQASQFVTDTFHEDLAWLDQVDQPMLNVAEHFGDLALYNAGRGATDQVKLDNAAARIALQIAAEAPGSRADLTEKVTLPGHVTKVTVFAGETDTSQAVFHDIDPGVGGILETVGVAVITLAAVISQQPELYYVAAAVDAAEAGKDFANGDILGGVLQLASAVGSFEIGLGGVNAASSATQAGRIIQTAAQGVGGVYGAVQSAQNGDPLGILAGALEATAAGASGLGIYDPSVASFTNQVAAGLGKASVALSVADAFKNGNIASGLVSSLSAIINSRSEDFIADEQDTSSFDGLPEDTAPGDEEPDPAPPVDTSDHRTVQIAGDVGAPSANSAGDIKPGGADNSINSDFLTKNEGGVRPDGYVPNNKGIVIGNSGVTVGGGVDLGSKTAGDLLALGVDPSTIAKLLPYLGLRGQPAFDYVSKSPFRIGSSTGQPS